VQAADGADLAQHGVGQLEAVVDLGGGAHVQQRALHVPVLVVHVDAAHAVGLVFLVGQPARGVLEAPRSDSEHAGAAASGR
jgi:hypothetical protein